MSEKTIRIELPDSQWVELYNLGRQSVRRIKQIAEAWDAARGTEGPTGVVGTAEQERLLRERVAAWHLIDPDSGLVLVDPATDDLIVKEATDAGKGATNEAAGMMSQAADKWMEIADKLGRWIYSTYSGER